MSSSLTFSKRVSAHPGIFTYTPNAKTGPLVLAVKDQLLVSHPALKTVLNWLSMHQPGITTTQLSTVFAGLGVPAAQDFHVLRLKLSSKTNIVEVARKLQAHTAPGDVSPNHVLIPAQWGHSCPYGPPKPVPNGLPFPAAAPPFQRVTVIDSGYQWDHAWGPNPLIKPGPAAVTEQEAKVMTPNGGWANGTADTLDVDNDHRLDALAGHGNFVAGVIARRSPHARISVWNHNGGFAPTADDYPTEAAVMHSIVMSQQAAPAKVICVGFAFTALDNQISGAWKSAFNSIGPGPIVVAPAGNQNDGIHPCFPAALNTQLPGSFPNMIGVASVDGALVKSSFSNFGPWVRCAAKGEQVVSTFLRVKMPVEDSLPGSLVPVDFTANSWATWSGTSFAAPKVVAEIANQLAANPGSAPAAAFNALTAGKPADPRLGVVFTF